MISFQLAKELAALGESQLCLFKMFSVLSALLRVSQQQGFAPPGRHVSKKALYHLGVEVGRWQHPVTGPLLPAHPGGLSPTAPETMSTHVPLEGTSRALKPDGVWGNFCSIFVLSQPCVRGKHPMEGKTTLWATSHLQLCPPGPCVGRTCGTDLLRAGAAPPGEGFGCCLPGVHGRSLCAHSPQRIEMVAVGCQN